MTRCIPWLTLAVYAVVATFGAFMGGLWASAGIGLAIVLFAATWIAEKRMPKPDRALFIFALIALAVMALLNLRSVDPEKSWFDLWLLVTIFVPLTLLSCAIVRPYAAHPKLFVVLPGVMALGAAALGIELYLGGPILHVLQGPDAALTEYNRGFSYLVILALPAIAGLWLSRGRMLILPLLLALFIPAGLTESRAAKMALIAALIVTLLAQYAPKFARRALAASLYVCIGWPFAARFVFARHEAWLAHLPASWRARMEIWDYMSYAIEEKPLLGWGLGTSHDVPFASPHQGAYRIMTASAGHPHNVFTQLWVELGLPGLALGIGFALFMLYATTKLDRKVAPFAIGAFAAALVQSLVAFNFWTDSLFAAFALTGFAFALLDREVRLTN